MQTTQKFILKLFSEIMVKGSSAKKQMVGQLYTNVQTLLKPLSADIEVKKFSDKIEVVVPSSLAPTSKEILTNTPGIEQVLEALQFNHTQTLDAIKEEVSKVYGKLLEGKSFVVRTKRSGKHDFTSADICREVGGYLLAHTQDTSVDLHTPEVTVYLELIDHQLNIITAKYKGLGGFPLGTTGGALSLISGGFDSTVSSYLSMRRGIKTHFIFFNLGGTAHEIGVKQVAYYLWQKFSSSHRVQFISVPFEGVVDKLLTNTPDSYMGVMLKRLMLEAAEHMAEEMELDTLITGEATAQVSSQTLRNLSLIDQATNKLVLRPLAFMDKSDIINTANDIGTKEFAQSMPEYCGVISKNPIIEGSFKRIAKVDASFNKEILQEAVQSAVSLNIDDVLESITTQAPLEVIHQPSVDSTIIDIRQTSAALEVKNEILHIPFSKLTSTFKTLPQNKEYLLYCDKGILSQLHGQYLKDEGFTNIKVYRPKD